MARKLVFHRVSENLYRLETSGGYYALLKLGDKQFRRSLKTKDRKLADRRLVELRAQVGNLTIGEDVRLSFDEVAEREPGNFREGCVPDPIVALSDPIGHVDRRHVRATAFLEGEAKGLA